MALEVATGTFNIGTGGVGTTVSVTGLSFQPKVVIFLWGGRTTVGQAEGTHHFGMGYMVGAADRGGSTNRSEHAAATTINESMVYDNAAIATVFQGEFAAELEGAADFDAWLVDGFRLIIDDAFPSDYLVDYVALGGSDITNVASTTVVKPAGTGQVNQDISIGFRPDCALAFGPNGGAINVANNNSEFALGAAVGTGLSDPVNAVLHGWSFGAVATTETSTYCRRGQFMASEGLTALSATNRAAITKWLDTGFRLNWQEREAFLDAKYRILCLQGPMFNIGFSETRNVADLNKSLQVPFTPSALLFASHNKIESAVDAPQAHDERTVGFATGPANRNVVGIVDKNAEATSDIAVDQRADAVYVNQSLDAAVVEEGRADLVSLDTDPGFTFVMDDADPSQNFFWYLAIGPKIVPGAAGTFGFNDIAPLSLLQTFAAAASPWSPDWWGGPTSMLFAAAAPAPADLATKLIFIPGRQMGLAMITGG